MVRFRQDGRFRIVQLTDLHVCDGSAHDRSTLELVGRVLDATSPDLVALTGDVIDGARARDPAAAWAAAVAPMVERGVDWAACFGNHDDEGALDRAALLEVQCRLPRCLSEQGAEGVPGVGNYVVPIASSSEPARPAALLYFLDSPSYARNGPGVYGWFAHEQVSWFRETSRALAPPEGGRLPALAFFHIPLPEYRAAWELGAQEGSKHENICCPVLNTGMFAAFHERGDVIGVFVGHDHANDFVAELHGIRLCYGRATGYNDYGLAGFARGARVIELTEGARTFGTWLFLDEVRAGLNDDPAP